MTRLIFVRHGETLKNAIGIVHDSKDPELLTPKGVVEIEKAAEALKKYKPDLIYASSANRTSESAEIIGKLLGIPLTKVTDLEERNWGDYAGLTFPEIKAKAGMDNMGFAQRYEFHPPNGESWKDVETRLLKFLNGILNDRAGQTIVIVTHGGTIRTLMPTLLGADKTESYKYDPDNASITVFDYDGKDFYKIIYNDTSHLSNS